MSGSPGAPDDPYAGGHGTGALHVEHYDLELDYRVRTNRLRGTARLRVRTLETVSELHLDLARLTVHGVTVTGATVTRYKHRGGRLVVRLARPVPAGTVLGVAVDYGGAPQPVASRWGPVGWEELEDGVVVASQPTGAPSWFPCNDRPDDKATYRTTVTVESPYRVVAHGVETGRTVRAGTTRWVFEETHPTPAYLATVQIGRYTDVELAAGPVRQRVVAPPVLAPLARDRLGHHPAIMDLFTELFGPYPFAEYALVVTADVLEIPVEAQGMAVFGANHLDEGSDGARLVPHELAHQWFGNSVSVASWQHLWLNEGFACYAEWLWSERSGGPDADRLAERHHAALLRLPQDLVLADPGPDDMFDDRVYKRGALTVHALRRTLGDPVFWPLVRAWTDRHRGGAVTTDDFRRIAREHAEAAGGAGLAGRVDDLLTAWLDGRPLPTLPTPPFPTWPTPPTPGAPGVAGHLGSASRTGTPS